MRKGIRRKIFRITIHDRSNLEVLKHSYMHTVVLMITVTSREEEALALYLFNLLIFVFVCNFLRNKRTYIFQININYK